MHFEIVVEDISGKKMLELLIERMIRASDTSRIHAYKGIGRIPGNMKDVADPSKRMLLTSLPKLLKGYGRTYNGNSLEYRAVVIVVCDLDDKNEQTFREELQHVLDSCNPRPEARFCLAVEEGEAWLLGDLEAVKQAFPTAKNAVLTAYENDSICGTWEILADAVFKGGAKALVKGGFQAVGAEKAKWASEITPYMNVERNVSPSFRAFRNEIQRLLGT